MDVLSSDRYEVPMETCADCGWDFARGTECPNCPVPTPTPTVSPWVLLADQYLLPSKELGR